jgi:hypothetical protein
MKVSELKALLNDLDNDAVVVVPYIGGRYENYVPAKATQGWFEPFDCVAWTDRWLSDHNDDDTAGCHRALIITETGED